MEQLWQDLRYGARLLRKTPGFTLVAIVTLALGIGANTAIFSIVNAVLLQRLPFPDSDRLVMVFEHNYKLNKPNNVINTGNFMAWRDRAKSFDAMAAMFVWQANVSAGRDPERVEYGAITTDLLPMVGVQPILGRNFTPDEAKAGAPNVVLISETYWRSHFNADQSVLGKVIKLDSEPATIVGVLPSSFELPARVALWQPWQLTEKHRQARGRFALSVGRLKPGVSVQQAQSEMTVLASSLEQERPDVNAGWTVDVVPLREHFVGDVRPGLIVMLGAVGLVLLIACVNVANLLMVRSAVRSREIAIRVALGVTRSRLVRQLLTESVLLSVIGGLVGILLARWMLEGLLSILPAELPRFSEIGLNLPVLAFSAVIALVTGVGFGLAPVFHAVRSNWSEALKESGRTSGSGSSHSKMRDSFVVAEAALALILLVGAGLLIRSFVQLLNVDRGFRPENVLTMKIDLPQAGYKEPAQVVNFYGNALDRIKSLPGVHKVGAISWLPLAGLGSATRFTVDDHPIRPKGEDPVADVRAVAGDYFPAMGIGLKQGRFFDSSDRADAEIKKVIINEHAARDLWPNQNPIGKRITMEWGKDLHAEVVGVVRDVRLVKLDTQARDTLYWFLPQFPNNFMVLVAHTQGDPKALAQPIRQQVAAIDPEIPVANQQTMLEVMGESVAAARFVMLMLAIFASVALTLAAIGIYGVISYAVTQRTHEIGVRMAFGAKPVDIARMVLGRGLFVIGIGIAIGIIGAIALTRFLETLLFQVSSTDPVTFVEVAIVLLVFAIAACYVPARRATRIDPMVALRCE